MFGGGIWIFPGESGAGETLIQGFKLKIQDPI